MKVFQIIIGTLPEELIPCVNSVKTFAEKNNHTYSVITETPEKYKNIQDKRIISNNLRIDELCKDSDACYFDWDVLLFDNFELETNDNPTINSTGDVIMHSGNVEYWKTVRDWMGNAEDYPFELGRIFNALCSGIVKVNPDMIIHNHDWKHLRYSGSK